LKELIDRYPNFSQADDALYMMGKSLERSEKTVVQSIDYYSRIVRDFPLSDHVEDAKKRLAALEAPIPQPDPAAVARMTYELNHKEEPSLKARVEEAFHRHPDVSAAQGKIGAPTMTAQGAAQADGASALIPRSGPAKNSITMENIQETNTSDK